MLNPSLDLNPFVLFFCIALVHSKTAQKQRQKLSSSIARWRQETRVLLNVARSNARLLVIAEIGFYITRVVMLRQKTSRTWRPKSFHTYWRSRLINEYAPKAYRLCFAIARDKAENVTQPTRNALPSPVKSVTEVGRLGTLAKIPRSRGSFREMMKSRVFLSSSIS